MENKWDGKGFTPITTPPQRPKYDGEPYFVQTKWGSYGIAIYYHDGTWEGYDEEGDRFEEDMVEAWMAPPPMLEKEGDG